MRLWSWALCLALLSVTWPAAASSAGSEEQARGDGEVSSDAQPLLRPQRPHEAPLLGGKQQAPPIPPEYLKHDQGGVRFACHPSARERMRALVASSDEIRDTLSETLGAPVLRSVEVRVAVGSSDFSRVVPKEAPVGAAVLALSELDMLVLGLPSGPISTSEVRAAFQRGMAYLALDEVAGTSGLPCWYRVGFALHFSGQASVWRAQSLWWASMQRRLIAVTDLDWHLAGSAAFDSVAAAEASDFVRFLHAGERSEGMARLVASVRAGEAFEQAMQGAYQQDLATLESQWREDVAKHKAFVPILLGGTLLWVVLALAIRLPNRWRRRSRPAEDEEALKARERKAVEPAKVAKRKRGRRKLPVNVLPHPDVPKVSHNGQWHTLH